MTTTPKARAKLSVPLIRLEIEARGARHAHRLPRRERARAPAAVRTSLGIAEERRLLQSFAVSGTGRHGSAPLERIETFARERGAVIAFLGTVDAVRFYAGHGYEVYGVLEDRPVGSKLHRMKKRLDRDGDR